ncbi:MAG: hypothetical protein IH602_18865 [Bryobacteraceae bacterium]|nr:hypothetical protein [Bryobacteraceae bacterium]
MRAILFFLAATLAWGQAPVADAAGSAGVRNVYLMPMPNGLEQFIANQLTSRGLMTVVADPNLADALFTDTVGKAFEKRYLELYPPPPPPKEEEEDEEQDSKKRSSSSSGMDVKDMKQERTGGFSRGKGTIFLVDRRTKTVLWSAYVRPNSSLPKDLDRAAKTIADRFEETVKKGGGLSR